MSLSCPAAAIIKKEHPDFVPDIGIILGSGLHQFADSLEVITKIPYQNLPGFPVSKIVGHKNLLVLAKWQGRSVICLQGRAHLYEGLDKFEEIKNYVRCLKVLGCKYFIATNAAGSLVEEVPPGSLMLINDHINLQPGNPLIGANDDNFGPRFFPLDNAYDKEIAEQLKLSAINNHVHLFEGVYLAVSGPNYETAAEIRAFKMLGANSVGMSTVPEILVAHHCGLRCGVISIITNYATGLDNISHDHREVVKTAEQAAKKLAILLKSFIANYV